MFGGEPVNAWSVGDWIFAGTLCLGVPLLVWALYEWWKMSCAATAMEALRAAEDGYVTERAEKYQELAEAHAAELVTCPVCLSNVPRNQTQITPVKQITEPGQSKRYMKVPVCDECIRSGESLVAGARAQRNPDDSP
jgi:hypothetical protein